MNTIKYTFFYFGLFSLIMLLMQCSKEEELSNTQMISTSGGKEWVTTEMIRDTTDITESISACTIDDVYKFFMDHTYEELPGDTSCLQGDSIAVMGSWYMNDIQTLLQVAVDGDTSEYIIRELEKNKIRLFYVEQESGRQFLWTLKPR